MGTPVKLRINGIITMHRFELFQKIESGSYGMGKQHDLLVESVKL